MRVGWFKRAPNDKPLAMDRIVRREVADVITFSRAKIGRKGSPETTIGLLPGFE
jgi:hypothetical protein